jgi:hypothetical protein
VSRWLKLIVAVVAVWLCTATTTASAATFAYDVPTIARFHIHPVGGDDVAETEFTAAREGSASPAADARATSTTPFAPVVATEAASGLDATELSMTRTVEQHIGEYATDGTLARPYADSRLTIQSIMDASTPVADPGGVPGALRWDVPGTMNGSTGTWQLVVDPQTKTILHFLFKGGG